MDGDGMMGLHKYNQQLKIKIRIQHKYNYNYSTKKKLSLYNQVTFSTD